MRRGYEAFNSGDMETLTELFDEGAVWHTRGNRISTLSASMRLSRRREVQRPFLPTSTSSSSPTLRFWATGSGSGRFTFTL
jgi:ketosteroid isomerase-like protein